MVPNEMRLRTCSGVERRERKATNSLVRMIRIDYSETKTDAIPSLNPR
jgi:hypothetical protein